MSQQHPQQPDLPYPGGQPPDAPPKKSGRTALVAIVAGIVGILIGAGITAAAMGGDPSAKSPASVASTATTPPDNGPTPDPITTPTNEPTTEPPAPAYGTPTKADFTLTAKVLGKQCFGSAGCNLRYRILISYTGPDLDPTVTYEVLYEVRGGEDGAVSNTLTVTGDTSSVPEEESVSTKSSKTKLTAVVTDVLSGS